MLITVYHPPQASMKLGVLVVVVVEILSVEEASSNLLVQVLEHFHVGLELLTHCFCALVDVIYLMIQPLIVLAQVHPPIVELMSAMSGVWYRVEAE